MEPALPWKLDARAAMGAGQRDFIEPSRILDTSAVGGFEFLVDELGVPGRRSEQVTIHAPKLAIDLLGFDDRFDAVNGRAMACRGDSARLFAA